MGRLLIGLGCGIILTVLLLTFAQIETLDDSSKTIDEATELGMVFPEDLENQLRDEILRELAHSETKTIEIQIPPNISAANIADILSTHGFNGEDFLDKITQLDVASKLKYGTFNVDNDSTTEELILILTN